VFEKYQCWVIFACFAVFFFFNSPVATPAHGFNPSLRLQFISENACLLALYIYATTHGPISLSC